MKAALCGCNCIQREKQNLGVWSLFDGDGE